VQYTSLLQR